MCGVLQPVGWDAVARFEVRLQVEEPAWGTAICGFVFFRSWYPGPYAITSAPLPSSYSIVVRLSMSITTLRFGLCFTLSPWPETQGSRKVDGSARDDPNHNE